MMAEKKKKKKEWTAKDRQEDKEKRHLDVNHGLMRTTAAGMSRAEMYPHLGRRHHKKNG